MTVSYTVNPLYPILTLQYLGILGSVGNSHNFAMSIFDFETEHHFDIGTDPAYNFSLHFTADFLLITRLLVRHVPLTVSSVLRICSFSFFVIISKLFSIFYFASMFLSMVHRSTYCKVLRLTSFDSHQLENLFINRF